MAEISDRKRDILRRVVEEYVATGEPVGSKTLVERSGLGVSPSTVRNELAELEALGLLTHPHTSAGRIPTDSGYRFYAEALLERQEPRPARFPLDLTSMRSEVDAALQSTTEMLSQVTRLLALVSAPGLETATVRHVEVLLLQPSVVMVVTITTTDGWSSSTSTWRTVAVSWPGAETSASRRVTWPSISVVDWSAASTSLRIEVRSSGKRSGRGVWRSSTSPA